MAHLNREESVIVDISKLTGEESANGINTIFAPQASLETRATPTESRPVFRAPEKQLTLFALRLAILEKSATSIGTLGFIWATVVLLGAFAVTLDRTDFWFVTVTLVIEGTRIFGRSHELEWQHQATWSLTDAPRSGTVFRKVKTLFCKPGVGSGSQEISLARKVSKKQRFKEQMAKTRTWTSSEVPVLPVLQWIFLSKNISTFLYWLQLASAAACVVLSMLKLVNLNFGEIEKGNNDKRNRNQALIIFYSLALADAVLFLIEKAYCEWEFRVEKLLEKVNNECELGNSGLISTTRFFYDSYSKCLNISIFDGLKMDMVSFAIELIESDSLDEQLIGVRILKKFSENPKFSRDTLQKIGVKLPVIARLLEMLNWKHEEEQEIRKSAAEILANLAERKQNILRIAEIPGALESISSLLHASRLQKEPAMRYWRKELFLNNGNYSTTSFNNLGLEILRKLVRDHDICGKIGNTRGLLTKVIDFLHTEEQLLRQPNVATLQIATVEGSLQLLQRLANTSSTAGKQLRKDISEIVFTVTYIRDILKYGEMHPDLQLLGIRILSSLATDEEATERIAATGGVLNVMFCIFFNDNVPRNPSNVREAAGEALATLSLQSMNTCHRILKLQHNKELVKALNDPLLRVNAARILRNLCCYSGNDRFQQLKGLTDALPTILKAIMIEDSKVQEVMMGAAASIFMIMESQESTRLFQKANITKFDLVQAVTSILIKYRYPSIQVPGIRRYTVELAVCLMKDDPENARCFRGLGMSRELESILDTTSELESFHIFSGTVGLYRHNIEMQPLIETAMALLLQKDI